MMRYGLYVGFVVTILLNGCQWVSQSIKDTFNNHPEGNVESAGQQTRATKREPVKDFLTDSTALHNAEQLLRVLPQFMDKPIHIYGDIHFYDDGRVITKLQHPDNPNFIDQYTYRWGEWSEPEPVQLSVREDVRSRLIALDSIPFDAVSRIASQYDEKAATIEGASSINHVYFVVTAQRKAWYPRQIDGARERWGIDFDRNGNVVSFERK